MFHTLLEQVSDVNGIVDAAKAGLSSTELGFTRTEEQLCEGEGTSGKV